MTEGNELSAILEQFETIEFLPVTGETHLKTRDGREFSAPGEPVPETPVVRSSLAPNGSTIELEFDSGETIVLDLPTSMAGSDERPVVYLDQNHWVDLARVRVGSKGMDAERAKTYGQFTELAQSGELIVPLSSGHLTELGRKSGQQRRDVAVTMLQLSRGWQMRNPLQVRVDELRHAFDPEERVSPVFTLEPDAMWTHAPPERNPPPAGDVSAQAQAFASDLSAAAALADVLASTEQIQSDEGLALATKWADSFSDLAQHVRTNPKAKAMLRDLSRARLLTDMQDDIAITALQSGLSSGLPRLWLTPDL